MASSTFSNLQYTVFFLLLLFTVSVSQPRHLGAPLKPNTLFLSVHKDKATNLHLINLRKRTPQVTLPLLLDLNAGIVWVSCDQNYSSSTYHAPFCHSTLCSRAGTHYCHTCRSGTPRPGCHNNTCAVIASNPLTLKKSIAEIAQDVVSIRSIDHGFVPHQWVSVPQFVFACAPSSLLQGISSRTQGVRGIAALSHAPVALPLQLASHFGFKPQFALCLSPSTASNGVVFFGHVPPSLQPRTMAYTPLAIGRQGEYLLLVQSIMISGVTVPFNLSTRELGGAAIATTKPYTALHHSIFKAFSDFFVEEMVGVARVEPVPPFGFCFDATNLTREIGPEVEFVFTKRKVRWKMDGLLRINENVSCMAFVDAGTNARAMITIGVHQLENKFLQFDLSRSRFGFIPSHLSTSSFSCSNLNFSSTELQV